MRTGPRWGFPLIAVLLFGSVLTACVGADSSERGKPPPTQIVVSVSAEAIHLVDPTTGDGRVVVSDLPDFRSGYATWSPDRKTIAYAKNGIHVLDPATGRSTRVVSGSKLSMAAWSPDGTRLAYSDGLSLWLTSLGRIAPQPIHVPAVLGPVDVAWSPGRIIAFQGVALDCSEAIRCVSTGSSEIWTIHADGTSLRQVSAAGHAEGPKWSSDDSELLFLRRVEQGTPDTELWMVDAAGRNARRLLARPGLVAADWSADGSQLAILVRGSAGPALELWVGRSDGTGFRRVGEAFAGTHASIDW
ncbi:MAG: TolB family protein [Actinomycetota bacterium]